MQKEMRYSHFRGHWGIANILKFLANQTNLSKVWSTFKKLVAYVYLSLDELTKGLVLYKYSFRRSVLLGNQYLCRIELGFLQLDLVPGSGSLDLCRIYMMWVQLSMYLVWLWNFCSFGKKKGLTLRHIANRPNGSLTTIRPDSKKGV